MKKTIEVPKFLVFEETIKFASTLKDLPEEGTYIFDFKKADKIDPFSLLYLSSELQFCRHRREKADFRAKNFSHLTYQSHMGFFKAFGLNHGKSPGEARGSQSYLPITLLNAREIRNDAAEMKVNPGEILEGLSKELTQVLTQTKEGDLYDMLVYSLREMLRNVVEHSRCIEFGLCAQYWPSMNRVSLAILDRGIGIKKSLSNNPNLNLQSDEDALKIAIEPGVSGKVFKGQKRRPRGDWVNSGFGLYMTSNICRNGGSFFIASGTKGLYLSEKKSRFLDTPINGTALNLTLDTAKISGLKETLADLREKAGSHRKASPSSLGLTKSFK
ncbi:hypothetical protein [Christiangramia flava]|uniref:Uncharacterized protein n=1 Tax=Christiangramia flava JLT2011 TaxID=1229726 RepID=A0A1L7I3J6_9FLAO|nr:hypothetical protein [Christiangramia flava]APU67753.1 hypothetical protein GRFL_1029 [Christiangramia flava JLT2011]OSS40256.1 hypothetical protein C723_0564 [Christiangramia flava JLT2011]